MENRTNDWTRRRFIKLMAMAGASAAVDWGCIEELAAGVKRKEDFPVVVIGAGNGGLVAAAYLVKYGFPVTLLEQHDVPGGYATSFDRAAGKFTFEVSLHATVAEHSIPQGILTELGVWDKLKIVYQPDFCRLVAHGYDLNLPAKDPEKIKKILNDTFPADKEGISRFIDDMVKVQEEMAGRMGKESVIAKLQELTLEEWLGRHVSSAKVRDLLSVFWAYYGLPPSRLNALFYAVATGQYLVTGGQYYKARSQDLSNTLMEAITQKGGQVMLGNGAKQIVLKQGTVEGVIDVNGKLHPAKAVIANASVPSVFGKLINRQEIPSAYIKKLSGYNPSMSSFIVWLGLNQELRGKIEGYEIFVTEDTDSEQQYRDCLSGDFDKAGIAVTIYDNLFKGYSKPGTSTVTVMTLSGYEPWKKYETDYLAGRKKAYNKEKERVTQLLIKRAEKFVIPGLTSMIEVIESATPLTNVRYTSNYHGSIYGFDREGTSRVNLDVRTPIRGLYLAGAWTHGGGYTPTMMAGRQATTTLLRDWKKMG
jgi:phytoene dehydrogenase-like protein